MSTSFVYVILGWIIFGMSYAFDGDIHFYLMGVAFGLFIASILISVTDLN